MSYTNCSRKDGGYAVIGSMVVVNIRITADSNATNRIIYGFPTNPGSYTHIAMQALNASNNTSIPCVLDKNGIMTVINTTANIDIIISGTYIAAIA